MYAANWSIDPTAHINVTVLDTFTTGATPILVDTGSDAIADFTGRITLSGATSGAVLKRAGGNIVLVKKTVTEADPSSHEWTGGTSDRWSVAGNWSDGKATASGSQVTSLHVWSCRFSFDIGIQFFEEHNNQPDCIQGYGCQLIYDHGKFQTANLQ